MDLEVKKEAEPNQIDSNLENSVKPIGEEDNMVLALFASNNQLKSHTSLNSSKRKPKKKKPLIETIKRCLAESVVENVSSGHGARSRSVRINNPSRGETVSPTMMRAQAVQSNLEAEFPNFAKTMVRSHVASCFWMGLPGLFCRLHLPFEDATFTLIGESGRQYEVKYLAQKTGLSAGWKQFACGHGLIEGDVLVFQLIEPTKFKVYVIRANDFTELDGALGLLTLDAHTDIRAGTQPCKITKRKSLKTLPATVSHKKNKSSDHPMTLKVRLKLSTDLSENDSEEVGSEVLENINLSTSPIQLTKNITSLEDFEIVVDGVRINSEISEDTLIKYYNLCYSQNTLLHKNLICGINSKLVAGTISETVNIADAIRSCKLTTSRDEVSAWDSTLKAFEVLGMDVGFLRARLRWIATLAYDTEAAAETRRYIKARDGVFKTEHEIRSLEDKVMELNEKRLRFEGEIENLKSKAEMYELEFDKEVAAPW